MTIGLRHTAEADLDFIMEIEQAPRKSEAGFESLVLMSLLQREYQGDQLWQNT